MATFTRVPEVIQIETASPRFADSTTVFLSALHHCSLSIACIPFIANQKATAPRLPHVDPQSFYLQSFPISYFGVYRQSIDTLDEMPGGARYRLTKASWREVVGSAVSSAGLVQIHPSHTDRARCCCYFPLCFLFVLFLSLPAFSSTEEVPKATWVNLYRGSCQEQC